MSTSENSRVTNATYEHSHDGSATYEHSHDGSATYEHSHDGSATYEYTHGGNAAYESGRADIIDLSANINPLGVPQGVTDAVIGELDHVTRYPDSSSTKLREQIAAFEGVSSDWVFCGNGASDIIFRLPRAVVAKKTLVTAPTFSDYERAAQSYGSKVIHHQLSRQEGWLVTETIVQTVETIQPDLVFICNPNNPTGLLTSRQLIVKLLNTCREFGGRVIIDECFIDFVSQADEHSSKNLLNAYQNLVIIKAFTKTFAMPGIRLGYLLTSDHQLLSKLYFHGADWPVSNLAQAAGIAALANARDFIKQSVYYITNERKALTKGLTGLGYKPYKSEANYVFFQNPYQFDLSSALDSKGVRIRSCANYQGLDESYYRVAVSTHADTARLLGAVADVTLEFFVDQPRSTLPAETSAQARITGLVDQPGQTQVVS